MRRKLSACLLALSSDLLLCRFRRMSVLLFRLCVLVLCVSFIRGEYDVLSCRTRWILSRLRDNSYLLTFFGVITYAIMIEYFSCFEAIIILNAWSHASVMFHPCFLNFSYMQCF